MTGNTLDILQRINTFMESIEDLRQMLRQIMKVSMEAVSAQASSVFLYNPDRQELWFDVVLGEKGFRLTERRLRLGEGIAGCAARDLEVINIGDASRDERFDKSWDQMTGFATRSILAVPMVRRGELVGVLEVINKRDADCFGRQDQELLRIIASQAAIAVENAKLFRSLFDKNRSLEQALAELKETQDRLIQAEKMSAIGNMSGQIMHDIRNPMSIIRMCCDMMTNPEIMDVDIPGLVNIIKEQVHRTVNMIRDFLDFARGETHLALREVSVAGLIKEIAGLLERDCGRKGIFFQTRLDYDGTITVDEDKIQRVLVNIINNAKEALTEGGSGNRGRISLKVTAGAVLPSSRSPTTVRVSRRISACGFLNPSSPEASSTAPGWGSRLSTRSSGTMAAASGLKHARLKKKTGAKRAPRSLSPCPLNNEQWCGWESGSFPRTRRAVRSRPLMCRVRGAGKFPDPGRRTG
jgi:signal transduction histidine kinase